MPTGTNYDRSLGRKFIFVTGGVMSGLGKGITAASAGRLLANAGFSVTAVKIDPYLNVDAGTMNPYQHGEVYVLKDGAEVDLDLGNYERFLGADMTADHNVTTGKAYKHVIEKERAGDYLGDTVQIIPHITDDIKRRVREAAEGTDVCIVEVGGTVGDIEGMPFLEAIRQFVHETPDEDLLLTHVTLVPYSKNGEQKTKPTQHSVKELRSIGLQPDVLVGRSAEELDPDTKEKIALFCDVPTEAVFSNPDVPDIYRVPLMVEAEGLDRYVIDRLELADEALPRGERTERWRELVTRETTDRVDVALVGKYALEDAYISIHEALKHAGLDRGVDVEVGWVDADRMDEAHETRLRNAGAVVVPGGFGSRGAGGKIAATRYARERNVPFLGLCFGFQLGVVEFARNVLDLENAHSAEIDSSTPHPVIGLLPDQDDEEDMGGTMRLGAHETEIDPETLASEIYGGTACTERHRHRYEVNPEYIDDLEAAGLRFSGRSGRRMEILELPRDEHPYFLGTQFHPEFRSRPDRASPPFVGLIDAALGRNGGDREVNGDREASDEGRLRSRPGSRGPAEPTEPAEPTDTL
ncbi:CTP synthase [Halobacteriales archaeon QS_8_65_32]|nr:MAG: CTP synthase [Halobacteriales archaeon QS_8_65_32]